MNYWERRQQELNKAMEKDEKKLKKRLSSYFDTEYRKLEKQIAAYYKQYGTDNVIQYRRLSDRADGRVCKEVSAIRSPDAGQGVNLQAEPSGRIAVFRSDAAVGDRGSGE